MFRGRRWGASILPVLPNTLEGRACWWGGGNITWAVVPRGHPTGLGNGCSAVFCDQLSFVTIREGRKRKRPHPGDPSLAETRRSGEMFTKLKGKCSKRSTSALEGSRVIDVQWQLYDQRPGSSTLLTLENKEAVCCDFYALNSHGYNWLRGSWVANCVLICSSDPCHSKDNGELILVWWIDKN